MRSIQRVQTACRTEETTTCPECNGAVARSDGDLACSECGLVLDDDRIDYRGNWGRTNERTGRPLTEGRHDRGLTTTIGRRVDGQGNGLSQKKRRQLGRLRREHTRGQFQSKAERNLAQGCTEIARMTSALELPYSIREEASSLFRRAQAAELFPGRSLEAFAAGTVYAACRCSSVTRSIDEIAEVARCDLDTVTLGYGVLNREFDLETVPHQPADLVPKIASACDVSDPVAHRALELAKIAEETGIANGRKPSGVAAGALYCAGQEHNESVTQAALAEAASVSPVTIRERYRELEDHGSGEE